MPDLRALVIGDEPDAWRAAGFEVVDDGPGRGAIMIGAVDIKLVGGDRRGIVRWEIDPAPDSGTVDGIETAAFSSTAHRSPHHPNLIESVDHVVMTTPDLDRTMRALADVDFEVRRVRDVPGTEPVRRQVFYWAGDTIIELVGPADGRGERPAALWGLALTSPDLARTAEALGPLLGPVKDAVQPGRHIATLRTEQLDVSIPIAVMSPHPRGHSSQAEPVDLV